MASPQQTSTYPFDAEPRREPVDARAVRDFWRAVRAQHPTPVGSVIVWVVLEVVLVTMVPMFGALMLGALLRRSPEAAVRAQCSASR